MIVLGKLFPEETTETEQWPDAFLVWRSQTVDLGYDAIAQINRNSYIYTIVRGRIKGAACGHIYGIYTALRRPQGVYC